MTKKKSSYGLLPDKSRVLAKLRFAYSAEYFIKVHAREIEKLDKGGLRNLIRSMVQHTNMVLLSRRKALEDVYFYVRRYEWSLKKIQQLETKRGYKPHYDFVHLMKGVRGADLKLRQELMREMSKQQYKK